ncbi:hypothetical protein [Bacillus solitudinis]|uniref:hypothetical protein n=1 Tax=Bacillus solitudinis TaxID=2014074 RepID=UPI000C23ED97|nr:hypothetical protein [Bacillus solitudinis]
MYTYDQFTPVPDTRFGYGAISPLSAGLLGAGIGFLGGSLLTGPGYGYGYPVYGGYGGYGYGYPRPRPSFGYPGIGLGYGGYGFPHPF